MLEGKEERVGKNRKRRTGGRMRRGKGRRIEETGEGEEIGKVGETRREVSPP